MLEGCLRQGVAYATDISDEEWEFVSPYLLLSRKARVTDSTRDKDERPFDVFLPSVRHHSRSPKTLPSGGWVGASGIDPHGRRCLHGGADDQHVGHGAHRSRRRSTRSTGLDHGQSSRKRS
jgi:hypothetical protein